MKALYISSESNSPTGIKFPARVAGSAPRRIVELDGLRGIAILFVVSFHYINNQLVDRTDSLSKAIAKATSFGWVGVDLFFVLSGFLIGSILIANKSSENYFKTFYVRRLVRIVPNYFLLLIVFVAIWNLPYFASNYFLAGQQEIPLWSYFLMVHNFYMASFHSLGNDALSITWSIGIEEQFYIIFPFIVFFAKRSWLPWILGLLIVSAIGVRSLFEHWIPKYVLLPSRMDGLSIGFLIAYFNYTGALQTHKQKIISSLTIVLFCVLAACAYLYWRYTDLGSSKHTFFAIAFGILVVYALALPKTWFGAILRNRALVWVGTISYSLYLFHYMILGLVHHFTGQTGIGIADFQDVIFSIVAFALSLFISWTVFNLLEQPMVKIGKRFKY